MKTASVSLLLCVSVLLLFGLTVSADHPLVLKFSEDPVMTGSDVTLYCENKNGDFVKAFFYFNDTKLGSDPRNMFTIHKVQRADEGLYSCFTDEDGKTPESRLRVRDPPPTSDPQTTTTVYTATAFNNNKANATVSSSSTLPVPVVAALGSLGILFFLVLFFLVVVGLVQLWRKQEGRKSSSRPVDVTYTDVKIRQRSNKREQPCDPDVVYSSVRAGI
ncbi:hypothetical protein EXN66_Car014134 [Channa argus]|uniref:Ig-like domain-containing protein n=1 Tax=Channa argus TaxID=215402 RepID=A0A6G1Q7Z5_CHAAH|nr:hypothetical protein EXN66_Car014134 [Channa argus]